MKVLRSVSWLVFVSFFLLGQFSWGQTYEMLMDYPGVTGEAAGGESIIQSMVWGVEREVTNQEGIPSVSPPDFSKLSITKKMDSASPLLAQKAAIGSLDGSCEFVINHAQTGNMLYKLVLNEVQVVNYSVSIDGGGDPVEVIGFTYTSITWQYQRLDEGGLAVGKVSDELGYNLVTATQIP